MEKINFVAGLVAGIVLTSIVNCSTGNKKVDNAESTTSPCVETTASPYAEITASPYEEKTNNNTLLKELYPYFRYLKEYDKTSFPDVMYLDELFEKNSYKKI